jgi:hypothetical protein
MVGSSRNFRGFGAFLSYARALWRSMLVFAVLGAATGGTLARAGVVGHKPTRLAPASQVVMRGSFQRIKGVYSVLASGDYLLLSTAVPTLSAGFVNTGWTVINNRLGTTTALDPQCRVLVFGPPWVLMSCLPISNPSDVELYPLADGSRQTVTPVTACRIARHRHPIWRPNAPARALWGPTGSGGTRVATTARSPPTFRAPRRVSFGPTRRTRRRSRT